MIKKIIVVTFTAFLLTGCYDQTDIENIKSIALICVNEQSIQYCIVTTNQGERKYGYELYSIDTDDLYYGIDKISEMTGKDVSLSHLEAMIFSYKCSYALIKKSINSLLEGTNTHPKVMTAFYQGDTKEIFEKLKIPQYSSISKTIDHILTNKYETITKCTAMELSCALNFDVPGCLVPMLKFSNDNILTGDSVFVNNRSMIKVDEITATFLSAIMREKGNINILYNGKSVPLELSNTIIKVDEDNAKVKLYISNDTPKQMFEQFENEIINYYNEGYDLFGFGNYINQRFIDVKSKNEFLSLYNDIDGWIKHLKVNIEVID